MFIERLSIKNLRNISQADLILNKKTNVIIGENAAGKTTILEAVDILSRGKSFRTNKTESLVKKAKNELYIGAIVGEKRKNSRYIKARAKQK